MPTDSSGNRVFISCVSDEFEKPGSAFPGLRGQLRHYLTRANCEVKIQEEFSQDGDADLIRKLAKYIRDCAAVVHLVGEMPGGVANKQAVADYFAFEDKFLVNRADLRDALGDFSGLTYTQWEALLALHYGKPLFVYATDKASAQQQHLDRLRLARKFPSSIKHDADLLGQLIGDIHSIIASVPKFTRIIAPSRILKHSPPILFGRDHWLDALDAAWAKPTLNVYTLVAWGGVGKTSLVAHWVSQRMAAKGWPGVERYFDWSFYSQGTGESRQTSSDLFIQTALKFFDDPDPILGSPWERGERLARLIRQHRTLLVLDGIEPLQYPVNDPQAGRLKDQALEALLQGLAADNPGLCIVTTREHLKNIENQATTEEQKLDKLVKDAAIALLRHLQIVGSEAEMEAAWKDAGGHALTLQLLGRFLADAHGGDIRHYKEVKFEDADRETQGRTAFKVMIAYERWLQSAGPERQRELAVLRLTGLFDRPMSRDCLQALRAEPAILGLTDTLVKLKETEWNIALKRLCDIELLTVTSETIDAHPLIREYFAKQLKETRPEAFKEAHSRLFDFLCKTTPHRPDTLDGLQPLYEAVVHGCLAGRHQEACDMAYRDRILRGTGSMGYYSTNKLGAIGTDLSAVAAFFDEPWGRVSPNLREVDQAWLLHQAGLRLRGLGRMTEALEPMRAGLQMTILQKEWEIAARISCSRSELEVKLGRLTDAVANALESINHADQSGDISRRMVSHTRAADALHQCGRRADAGAHFAEAERMQRERQPKYELLYSKGGFRYCDWLLAPAERSAWHAILSDGVPPAAEPHGQDGHSACTEVERRGKKLLEWQELGDPLLDHALDALTLARVDLVRVMLTRPLSQPTLDLPHVATATNGLRAAGQLSFVTEGLLTAALYHFVRGDAASARAALDEAQQIAERGPMPLYLADVRLHRARMFRDQAELTKAAKLIRELGYGRRYEELADAEQAAASWATTVPQRSSPQPTPAPAKPESESTMSFHVFLSHNSKDKPAVKQLGLKLKQQGLNPWLDEWELRPGLTWQDALEDIIKTCQSAAICVAGNGLGPWEDPEMQALLRRFVNEKKTGKVLPVIPVLLPGAPADVKLPLFLEAYTWVDVRGGLTTDGIDRLVWGITGKKPNP